MKPLPEPLPQQILEQGQQQVDKPLMRVLIADDDTTALPFLKKALAPIGCEILIARDGNQAWEMLSADNAPRLAILDWQMPGMDGTELCRRTRALHRKDYTYLILVTGKDRVEDIIEGMEAGADDYVTKPIRTDVVQARLRAAMRVLKLEETLQHELAERERAEEALALLNEQLEKKVSERTSEVRDLLEQKVRFIRQLGHDLRTPLVPLVAVLPVLEQETQDPRVKEMIRLSIVNVRHMRDLVDKTLQFMRFDAKEIQLLHEKVDIQTLSQEALGGWGDGLQEKGISENNNIAAATFVWADETAMREIFFNLISNAVKYMGGPGTIAFNARQENGMVEVSTSDTGIGMEQHQIEHIFEEFYKADTSRHDLSSSGLGMSICQRIIERHGGKIWVESAGPGKGTTVYFTVPAAEEGSSLLPGAGPDDRAVS